MKKLLTILSVLLLTPFVASAAYITVPQSTAYGQVLIGNQSGGNYTPVATSTLNVTAASILGLIAQGANVTITGNGTAGSPYTISSTGGSGGSGGGTWATTTSTVLGELINYSLNNTDIVTVGGNSTSSAKFIFDPNSQIGYFSSLVGIGTKSPSASLSITGSGVTNPFLIASSSGNTMLTVLANGNVGIGTTSPYAQVAIQALPATYNTNILTISSSTAAFATTTLLNFNSNGQLLLQSTDSTATHLIAVGSSFWVRNDGAVQAIKYSAGNITINNNANTIQTGDNTQLILAGTSGNPLTTGPVIRLVDSNNSIVFYSGASILGTFSSNGNFGIGTTSPFAMLDILSTTTSQTPLLNIASSTNGTATSSALYIAANGQSMFQDGTAALPAISFSGDNTTGWYRDASNVIRATVAGVRVASFTATGLQVFGGTGSASAPNFSVDAAGTTGLFTPASATLGFTTGGAEAMRINSSGFVGISTTSPFTQLSIGGSEYVGGNLTATGTVTTGSSGQFTVSSSGVVQTTNDVISQNGFIANSVGSATSPKYLPNSVGAGGIFFPDVNAVGFTNGTTETMRITDVGNVGIGSSTPWGLLTVASSTLSGVPMTEPMFVVGTSTLSLGATTTDFIVDQNGNVGVHTSTPTSALYVVGTLTVQAPGINGGTIKSGYNQGNGELDLAANGASPVILRTNGEVDITSAPYLAKSNSLSVAGNIYTAANLGIGTTSPFTNLSIAGSAYIGGNLTATGTVLFTDGTTTIQNGNLMIGTTANGGNIFSTSTPLQISTSTNNYVQALIYNGNSGSDASADFVVANNQSTNGATYFGDLGINGSGFSQTGYSGESAGDVYLQSSDSNLDIEAASSTGNNSIKFFSGGAKIGNLAFQINATSSSFLTGFNFLTATGTSATTTNFSTTNLSSTAASTTALNVSQNFFTIGPGTAYVNGTSTPSFNLASSTLDATGNSFSVATSTFLLRNSPTATKLLGFWCEASTTGTAIVNFSHSNGNKTEAAVCTTGAYTQVSTNNTWTSFEDFDVQASSTAGKVSRITVTPAIINTSN